jgi:hypothetical protein
MYNCVLRLSKTHIIRVSLTEQLGESETMKCVYPKGRRNFFSCTTNSVYQPWSAGLIGIFGVNER